MNIMAEIAKLLGVEIEERFKIMFFYDTKDKKESKLVYYLSDKGLHRGTGKSELESYICDDETLRELLTGIHAIIKLPRKPKDGEKVWYWGIDTGSPVWDYFRSNDLQFLSMYRLGKLYRTKAEAEAHMEDKYFWNEIRKELEE